MVFIWSPHYSSNEDKLSSAIQIFISFFSVFSTVLFVTAVREKFLGLLRLYQFLYIIVCSLLTTTAMVEFVKIFIDTNEKVDYLFFIVWIFLVVPTAFMVKLLATYIQQIAESSLLNV